MRLWGYSVLCLAVFLTASSCKITSTPTEVGPQAATNAEGQPAGGEQDRIQEILDYQKATGESLDSLLAQLRQGEGSSAALQQDLDAAGILLDAANSAAASQNADALLPLLHRLSPVLRSLEGDLPAAIVARYCERALAESQRYAGVEAKSQVSSILLAARRVLQNAQYATLVPNVEAMLKAAKDAVDASQMAQALPSIQQTLNECSKHPSLTIMANCMAAARGAEDAANRQAWIVAKAELEQLDSELRKLESDVKPATTGSVVAPAAAANAPAQPGNVGVLPANPQPQQPTPGQPGSAVVGPAASPQPTPAR